MKRAFIIHGWEGSPEGSWRPWLKKKLEEREFKVSVPQMPDTMNPAVDKWVSHLAKLVGDPDKYCYFVGHSLGCITILRYLEGLELNEKVGGVVLIAGFGHDLDFEGYKNELARFFKIPINWGKIKKHCSKFVAIHSDDDPYVPLEHNTIFKEKLGAESIIMHNMKHFSGDDGVMELPVALESLLKIAK